MRATLRPSSLIPPLEACGVNRFAPVERTYDPEYSAQREARVAALEKDPRYQRCRQCVEEAEAEATRLGLPDANISCHCDTRCPLNPEHQAAIVWAQKRDPAKRKKYLLRKRAYSKAQRAKRTKYVSPYSERKNRSVN